jgi:starch synthase
MRILFASSEVVPFAKTGGLADVAGALPKELAKMDNDVVIIMPRYRQVSKEKFKLKLEFDIKVELGGQEITGSIYSTKVTGSKVRIYFVDNPLFFDRQELYQESGIDYEDNAERFIFYSKAVFALCQKLKWSPEIMHCNDWQTGLIPVLLKDIYNKEPLFKKTRTIFTVHNLAYQGLFEKMVIEKTGLSWEYFSVDRLEFWGKLNFMKGGLLYADKINTVSRKYSEEIQTEEFGAGLNGVIKSRQKDLYGIINGVDYKIFSPTKDPHIHKPYSLKTLEIKEDNKKHLLKKIGLRYRKKAPLLGIISRLADQKGFDILSGIMEKILEQNVQFVLLGTGMPKYHKLFATLEEKFPKKMKAILSFDPVLAQEIYAGVDIFLMPSHYEPCGLGQLISMKYGTIPVVRETGGLADTVVDFDLAKDFEQDKGNGFVFQEYDKDKLFDTIMRSVKTFKDESAWHKVQANAMKSDYSWKNSAKQYIRVYEDALQT